MSALEEYAANGRSWGKVAVPMLASQPVSSVPEWRRAWLEAFLAGVTEYVTGELEGTS